MFVSLLLFLNSLCISTDIDVSTKQIPFFMDGKEYYISQISVFNNSQTIYYTWYDTTYEQGDSRLTDLQSYFCRFKGDFNLIQLLTDNVFFLAFKPKIGVNFLKELLPGESFIYYVISNDCNDHSKYIRASSQEEVNNLVGAIVNRNVLYNGDIVLFWNSPRK